MCWFADILNLLGPFGLLLQLGHSIVHWCLSTHLLSTVCIYICISILIYLHGTCWTWSAVVCPPHRCPFVFICVLISACLLSSVADSVCFLVLLLLSLIHLLTSWGADVPGFALALTHVYIFNPLIACLVLSCMFCAYCICFYLMSLACAVSFLISSRPMCILLILNLTSVLVILIL